MPADSYILDAGSLPLLWGERILFNGFVFNDHGVLERARINSIDGLMDSDLRDSRQDIPDQDGEDFFDLLRGGRTLSFDGELSAGNLHSLANLRQRMKSAISGIDDLWFNRYDWDEDFKTAAVVTTALTNLITNPSFEVDLTGWQDQGSATGRSMTQAAHVINGAFGAAAAHHTGTSTAGQFIQMQYSNISVTPGKNYTLTAIGELIAATTTFFARVRIMWVDEFGTLISYSNATDETTLGIKKFRVSGVAPAGATTARIQLILQNNTGAGTLDVWWDSVMFVQSDTPFTGPYFDGSLPYCNWTGTAHNSTSVNPYALCTMVNQIANPSFENQTTAGWGALRGVLTTAATGSGVGSYKGRNTVNAAGTAGWNYQNIPVCPGQTYTAFGRFVNLSGRTGQLNIEWRDGDNALISTTGGASNTSTAARSTSAVAPANAVEAVVTLYAASAQIGDLIEIDACGFVMGSPAEYFDGDSDGCFWKGYRNVSESVQGTPVPIASNFLAYVDEDKITHVPSIGKLTVADPGTAVGAETFLYKPWAKPTCDARMITAISDVYGSTGVAWCGHAHKVIKPGTVGYANSTTVPRGEGLTADLIAAVFHFSSGKFAIWRVANGNAVILAQTTISNYYSTRPLWYVTEMRGNDIMFELWYKDPRVDKDAYVASTLQTTLTLTGNDAIKYGAGVHEQTGLWLGAGAEAGAGMRIQEHAVEGLNPSDALILNARRNSSIAGRESQDAYQYKRGFQFTLRSSDPMIYSKAQEFGFIFPTAVADYGASYDWEYDVDFDSPIDSSGNVVSAGAVTVKNLGDADAYPEINFVNYLLNPTLTNLTTGESLMIRGTVGEGEWKSYNMRTGYSIDSVGDDCSGLIDPSSDRVRLVPGDNVLVVTAQNSSSFGGVSLKHRSTFK